MQNNLNGIKILLVDDDPDIIEFLTYNLIGEGFRVYSATQGKEAIEMAEKHIPDLILMDVMMPVMDGIEATSAIRKIPKLNDCLIAFLTARSEDYSQIAGFETGADDYIVKPIKPRLLISKIKSLLRRSAKLNSPATLRAGTITLDRDRYLVIKEGLEISMPRKEFELLYLLASKPGHVFGREHILNKVWGTDVIVGDRTIDVHIRKLREKIGNQYIVTVKGIGYKFEIPGNSA